MFLNALLFYHQNGKIMANVENLKLRLEQRYSHFNFISQIKAEELTLEVPKENLRPLCIVLRDDPELKFEQLMDVAGVDYFQHGVSEWETVQASTTGFERGVQRENFINPPISAKKNRFAVVYHLLSITHNHRIALRVFVGEEPLFVDSLVDVWSSANWNEREAYDLFGIIFENHPDLRRILTDYGFIGHPFRKDFPLIGDVEARFDAAQGRVIYEPVSIEPRTLVPKVIRTDHSEGQEKNG